jgi:hypothetical protein
VATETTKQQASEYPAWWDWETEGDELAGTFLRLGKGFTVNGEKAFVVLDVDGAERTLWLHHGVLHNVFARELHRRPEKEFVVGERIEVRQLGTKESGSGREYMNYRAEFPDGPQSSQADILGPPSEPLAQQDDTPADVSASNGSSKPDDDVPF